MIRTATKDDIEEIIRLGNIVNPKFEKVYNTAELFNHDYSKIYLDIEDEKVVGMLMATVLYETCEIENIVVLPDYRRRNIASSLIDYLISDFNKSVNTITLEVAVDNENAINLYKKFGLNIINTRKNYYDNKDAYLMGVNLNER